MGSRVACYTPTVARCGVADYARRLVGELMNTGHRVEIVATEPALENGGYVQVAEKLNTFDLVHVHYEHGFFLHADRFHQNTDDFFSTLTVPLVITFHCLPDLTNPIWQYVFAHRDCRVVVHTRYQFDQLDQIMPVERLTLHYHPAIEPSWEPPGPGFHQWCTRLAAHRLIGMYGFVKRHKNYDAVLDALVDLPDDVILVCIGGPQDESDQLYCEKIRHRMILNKLDHRVIFTGYLEEADAHAWIRRLDIFLAPYNWVSASGSIATALGCEAVILASDLAPNVDIADRYHCMALYKRNDSQDLVDKIKELLSDDSMQAGLREGARKFNARHSVKSLADTIGELYRCFPAGIAT
jgi:glycosyltransferase involved in cell wall biosynthesis